MNTTFQIAAFDSEIHSDEVIELWVNVFGYETAHNEPSLVIHRKKEMKDGLFFVSLSPEGKVTGTVIGGYDGHRGWIYSLSVSPNLQRSGIGTALINHAEAALESKGYMKINLQIMEGNAKNQAFYETVGYTR